MTTMIKEPIRQILNKWDFPILEENENSLIFRYQMNYIQVSVTGDEYDKAISLSLSGFYYAKSEKEMMIGLCTCNDLNCNLLQVKLYIDSDSTVNIVSEFFLKSEVDLEYLFKMGLQTMVVAKKHFFRKFDEIQEESNIISELGKD